MVKDREEGGGRAASRTPPSPAAMMPGAATCPAPSMGSDGAELPQTQNKAKPR